MSNCIDISFNDFENEVITSNIPVLLDLWAPWCAPCKRLSIILEEIAKDYYKTMKFCKINIDKNEEIAIKFNIKNIPTIMIFKDGNHQETKIGIIQKNQLTSIIKKYI